MRENPCRLQSLLGPCNRIKDLEPSAGWPLATWPHCGDMCNPQVTWPMPRRVCSPAVAAGCDWTSLAQQGKGGCGLLCPLTAAALFWLRNFRVRKPRRQTLRIESSSPPGPGASAPDKGLPTLLTAAYESANGCHVLFALCWCGFFLWCAVGAYPFLMSRAGS